LRKETKGSQEDSKHAVKSRYNWEELDYENIDIPNVPGCNSQVHFKFFVLKVLIGSENINLGFIQVNFFLQEFHISGHGRLEMGHSYHNIGRVLVGWLAAHQLEF